MLVQESPSNLSALRRRLRITRPASYFTMASGGLGFGLPAAVGIALAERDTGRGRPVVAVIGDGSFHYSVQALWTAAQLRLSLLVLVPVNQQYAILKAFAELKHTPGVPALDLPGLDIIAVAHGYGCAAEVVDPLDRLGDALGAGAGRRPADGAAGADQHRGAAHPVAVGQPRRARSAGQPSTGQRRPTTSGVPVSTSSTARAPSGAFSVTVTGCDEQLVGADPGGAVTTPPPTTTTSSRSSTSGVMPVSQAPTPSR